MTILTPQTPEQMLDCGCPENRGVSRRNLFRMAAVGGLATATTLSGAEQNGEVRFIHALPYRTSAENGKPKASENRPY